MKNSVLIFFPLLLVAGCTTVAKYEPKTASGPPKPADYPIYVYTGDVTIPRPFEVIGTMKIGDTPITVIGGSVEDELNTLRKTARLKGADALQLTTVENPGLVHSKFRIEANLIRFTNAWETIFLSEEALRTYLRTNAQKLDPIEGIWVVNDAGRSRVGIMKTRSQPGKDFVAFILGTTNPSWHAGCKKMDLFRGERPGLYRAKYYLDDFQSKGVAFMLRGQQAGTFAFQTSEAAFPVVFTKQ
jgi:hypothetical protein